MPNVVVYVKQRHADSFEDDHAMKVWVREAVDRALSERELPPDGAEGSLPSRLAGSGSRSENVQVHRDGTLEVKLTPEENAAWRDRFKGPDPKPGKKK